MKVATFGIALVIACTAAGASSAKSGAELIQDPEVFAIGFVWGAANYMAEDYILGGDTWNKLTAHRAKCLAKSGITANTLYDAVVQEIKSDPAALSRSAIIAISNVVYKMCGPPPKT